MSFMTSASELYQASAAVANPKIPPTFDIIVIPVKSPMPSTKNVVARKRNTIHVIRGAFRDAIQR